MLTHANFTGFLGAFNKTEQIKFIETDTYLSFLPLPHVFERVVITANVVVGSHIM